MSQTITLTIGYREKPHDHEWNDLDRQKLPFLLNYSQCKLNEGDFYSVIEHCTSALKTDPSKFNSLAYQYQILSEPYV